MRTAVGLRRLRAERRLFEVHARLAVARAQAELAAGQHRRLAEAAEAARARTAASETARSQRELEAARRRCREAAASLAAARSLVVQLEAVQDAALDDLLGAAT